MQTTILITGQIGGNGHLKSAISTAECEVSRRPNGGYELTFKTKKEAKKALWEGFKKLRSEEPQYQGLNYSKYGSLAYDASRAEILEN